MTDAQKGPNGLTRLVHRIVRIAAAISLIMAMAGDVLGLLPASPSPFVYAILIVVTFANKEALDGLMKALIDRTKK